MNETTRQQLIDSGLDVDGALHRLMENENLYIKLLGKFLSDNNYEELTARISEKDYKEAFHNAHTLKGVGANLGLAELTKAVEVVVEKLRAGNSEGIEGDMREVTEKYNMAVEAIRSLTAE